MQECRDRQAPHALLAYCASIALVVFVGSRAQHYALNAGFALTEVFLIALPAAIVLYLHRSRLERGMFRVPGLKPLALTGFIGLCAVVLGVYKGLALRKALVGFDPATMPSDAAPGVHFALIALLPPLCEELLFRPALQRGLARHFSSRATLFYTALLFALFHLNLLRLPETFIIGLFAGMVFLKTRNFWCAALVHLISNSVGPILWRDFDTFGSLLTPGPVLVLSAIAIFCAYLLGERPAFPLRTFRARVNWAFFGAPQEIVAPPGISLRSLSLFVPVALLLLIGYSFYAMVSTPLSESGFTVSQADKWTVDSSNSIRVSSELTMKKVLPESKTLELTFPLRDAELDAAQLDAKPLPFSKTRDASYRITFPEGYIPSVGTVINVTWRVPMASITTADGGYLVPLRSLAPSDSLRVLFRLDEDSGYAFSQDPGAKEALLFGATSESPKRTYGELRVPIARAR